MAEGRSYCTVRVTVVLVLALLDAAVTVIVDVPAGVPLFLGAEYPPPHPATATTMPIANSNAHVANVGVRL